MVNTPKNGFIAANPNLPWPPPRSGEGEESTRVIPFQIWNLEDFKLLAERQRNTSDHNEDVLVSVTNQCANDLQNEELTLDDVAQMVLDLLPEDYVNSQWCQKTIHPGVKVHPDSLWLPCDAYSMPTVSVEGDVEIHKVYYIKMCKSLMGTVLLLVSIHPSKYE